MQLDRKNKKLTITGIKQIVFSGNVGEPGENEFTDATIEMEDGRVFEIYAFHDDKLGVVEVNPPPKS